MTSYLTDIGFELSVLVHHLYKKYKDNYKAAFCELALRTRCACRAGDLDRAKNVRSLWGTQWFSEMTDRYRRLRQNLKKEHSNDLKEAEEVMRSLYPDGCRVKEYVDALQTCAAMLTQSISRTVLLRFAPYRAKELAMHGSVTVTADELVNDFLENLLVVAITPAQWWRCDTEEVSAAVSVKKVGLRARPPEIQIVCLWSGRLRCYRIHLAGVLHESGPTAPLARRLARTHGALLDEERFGAYLARLQGLLRKMVTGESDGRKTPVVLMNDDYLGQQSAPVAREQNGAVKTIRRSVDVVRKADVGLLYRDPEAALENVDLNDADDVTLREFKAKMEEKFLENILRPGDPGYQYDKRVDVKPTERSDWDDSD